MSKSPTTTATKGGTLIFLSLFVKNCGNLLTTKQKVLQVKMPTIKRLDQEGWGRGCQVKQGGNRLRPPINRQNNALTFKNHNYNAHTQLLPAPTHAATFCAEKRLEKQSTEKIIALEMEKGLDRSLLRPPNKATEKQQ